MTLPVVWLPEADADLRDALAGIGMCAWGLGERFALAIEAAVKALKENPLRFLVIYCIRHRAGVRRFHFRGSGESDCGIAYFHARRDPRRWQSR